MSWFELREDGGRELREDGGVEIVEHATLPEPDDIPRPAASTWGAYMSSVRSRAADRAPESVVDRLQIALLADDEKMLEDLMRAILEST